MTDPSPVESNDESGGHQALADALGTSFRLLRAGLLVLIACYLLSGIFVVQPSQRALVLTLGQLTTQSAREPGLHITWPRPFAEIIRVPYDTTRTLAIDTFWNPPPPSQGGSPWTVQLQPFAVTISGDVNVLNSRWALNYQIRDPAKATFAADDLEGLLQFEAERAIVQAAASRTAEQLLYTEVDRFRAAVEQRVQQRIDELKLGVRVQRLDLLSTTAPWPVVGAFDSATRAEQERSQQVSSARAAAARDLLEAEGKAAGILAEAQTAANRIVALVKADADYFQTLSRKPPDELALVTQTMLQDTLRRSLQNVDAKYVVHHNEQGQQQIRMLLGPERNPPIRQP